MRPDRIHVAAGGTILVAGALLVRRGSVSEPERVVFRAINDLPGWLQPLLWPVVQLGALAVGPLVAVVAAGLGRRRLALAAVLATAAKLVSERLVKLVVSRQRPGTSIGGDVNARGDVPLVGDSFVSGHAVLVTSLAVVLTPWLSGRWRVLPWAAVVGVGVGRIYDGSHNPLDVVCGTALGLAIGGTLNIVLPPPSPGVVSRGAGGEPEGRRG